MKAHCPILDRPTEVVPTEFSKGDWLVARCTETQFVFLLKPPPYEALEGDELEWQNSLRTEQQRRWREEPILSRLSWGATQLKCSLFPSRNRFFKLAKSHLPMRSSEHPLKVVDIGCGSGKLLSEFHRRFAERRTKVVPHGIEVSRQLARDAAKLMDRLDGTIVQKNAIAASQELDAGSVDLIIMSSFLEHECQPLRLLRSLHEALAETGVIVLKVPNLASVNRHVRGKRWCGFRYPDHVNYFTPATLSRLATEAGFECHQTFMDTLPLSDNMYAVLRKHRPSRCCRGQSSRPPQ